MTTTSRPAPSQIDESRWSGHTSGILFPMPTFVSLTECVLIHGMGHEVTFTATPAGWVWSEVSPDGETAEGRVINTASLARMQRRYMRAA